MPRIAKAALAAVRREHAAQVEAAKTNARMRDTTHYLHYGRAQGIELALKHLGVDAGLAPVSETAKGWPDKRKGKM